MATDIPDYILQVLARFGPLKSESDGWVVPCPCLSHSSKGSDRNPSLRLSIGDAGKLIVHCRTGCSTEDVLASIGLTYADLFCPTGEDPASPLIFEKVSSSENRDVDLLHDVYTHIITFLGLHASHVAELELRGMGQSFAMELGYRSLLTNFDQDNLLRSLQNIYGDKLVSIPGFKPSPTHVGKFVFAIDPKGMVLPIRGLNNKIISLKTRRSYSPKYIIWSTTKGPSAGTPVHCPLNRLDDLNTIRITEGEIKSDIAYKLSGTYTISIPGVNAWPSSLPIIQALSPRRVLLSFDYPDVITMGGVARLLRLFAEDLVAKGYDLGFESWDITNPKAKGIDDALTLGLVPTQTWGIDALNKIRSFHDKEKERVNFFTAGEPQEFPVEVFPPSIREFIRQHSQSLQCPEDFMSIAVLAVTARCLGTTRGVALDNYWSELSNEFLCIVAPPSSGKSPACKRILAPLKKLQKKDAQRYEREKSQYRQDIVAWREDSRVARRANAEVPDPPDRPRKIQHYWVSDITVETVAKRLNDNAENIRHDPSLLYYRDEIISWIKSLNAYRGGKGADREFFLSCWSNEDIKVDRKTEDETIIVSGPALTVLGGIQPDILPELQSDSSGKDDGFFARLLFSYPNTTIGFEPSSFEPDAGLEIAWETVVRRLLALLPSCDDPEDGDGVNQLFKPHLLPLSPEAIVIWNEWLLQDTLLMRTPTFPQVLLSSYGKHRAILARIALSLHMIVNASIPESESSIDTPITASALISAIKVLDYFRSHYQRVLKAMTHTPDDRRVESFVKHVLENCNGTITLRDIYRKRLFGCKGKEDAENLCKKAADRGFGVIEKMPSTGQKPFLCFLIQGVLHD